MPTLPKPQLTERESPWEAPYDQMYAELCRDRAPILMALGFYAEHDLPPPDKNSTAPPTKDEGEELRQIGSALTVAAAASAEMSIGVLIETLKRVSKNPGLFLPRELPQPVEWAIAADYRRGEESPGTHWRDVWGDQTSPREVEQPTELNIAKAAAAAARLQETQKAGRPYNQADKILAVRLGAIFRRSGQSIRRHREPVMRQGKVIYIEGGGPIHDFLELVLKPLRAHLHKKLLAPVTTETIVRRITEDFPKAS